MQTPSKKQKGALRCLLQKRNVLREGKICCCMLPFIYSSCHQGHKYKNLNLRASRKKLQKARARSIKMNASNSLIPSTSCSGNESWRMISFHPHLLSSGMEIMPFDRERKWMKGKCYGFIDHMLICFKASAVAVAARVL